MRFSSCFCLEQGRPPYLNMVGTSSLERWCQLVFLGPSSVVTAGLLGLALVWWAPPQSPFCVQHYVQHQLLAAEVFLCVCVVFFLLVWF